MTAETVREIAGRLTKAQREAVLHGKCGVPPGRDEWSSDCICASEGAGSLYGLGIATPRVRFPGGVVLTPLGYAVRSHIQGEEK